MAMPASGCINLHTCITGIACSSIACAVDGNATGSKCLLTLSVTAGKTAPHSMSEFYGYTPNTDTCFCTGAQVTACATFSCYDAYFPVCMYNREVGDIVTVCFDASQSSTKLQSYCYYTSENGGAWSAKGGLISSFSQTGIDYNDTLCVRMTIEDFNIPDPLLGFMDFYLKSTPAVWTTGSGTAIRCSPYGCQIILGAI